MKTTKLFSLAGSVLPVVEGLAGTPRRSPRSTAAQKTISSSNVTTPTKKLSSPTNSVNKKRLLPQTVTPPAKKKARKRSSPPKANKKRVAAPRTESFSACWAGSLTTTSSILAASSSSSIVEPHTLILGTHPSIKSLSENQYYGHPMNAFWWIAGDCLGFRRGTGISPSTGTPYKFTPQLRSDQNGNEFIILPYEQQLEKLVSSGFALWDVIGSCQRPGSLDQDIQNEHPNDIVGFCRAHPSIRTIVLANGGTGSSLFVKHFADWFATGQLVSAAEHEASQKAFGSAIKKHTKMLNGGDNMSREGWTSDYQITLLSAISVSPAAARYSYEEKRDFWDEHVYSPGLAMLHKDVDPPVQSPYFTKQAK